MENQLKATSAYDVYSGLLGLQASNVNQKTPFGTTTYTPTAYEKIQLPKGPEKTIASQYKAETTLTPEMQALLDSYVGGLSNLGQAAQSGAAAGVGKFGQPLDLSASLGAVPQGVSETDRASAIDALMKFQEPQTQADRAALEAQMASQGITTGSAAYGGARQALEDQVARNRLGAVQAGQEFAQQNYGTAMQSRQQAINEILSGRSVPLNEIMSMLQATGAGIQQPTTGAAPVAATQIEAPRYQYYPGAAQTNQGLSALTGLAQSGASIYGASQQSERRVKRDIVPLGFKLGGVPFYAFRYLWSDELQVGAMFDEVVILRPDAALVINGAGFVDYGRLLG